MARETNHQAPAFPTRDSDNADRDCSRWRYRQHNPGYDYYQPGIYHITLVVGHRDKLLGHLNMDPWHPAVILSDIGNAVMEEWEKTVAIQEKKGHKLKLYSATCMPNHFHGVIEVKERMNVSLGYIIQLFKASCTSRYRKITGFKEMPSTAAMIRHYSRWQRQSYYATRPRIEQPLFDDDYDDTICLKKADGSYDDRHLSAMVNYVIDNPRRAIIIKLNPQFMEKRLHLIIGGRDYAAFGNLFLLRWSRKVQVFCHRKARLFHLTETERQQHGYTYPAIPTMTTRVPYVDTQAFRQEHDEWIRAIMDGQTVIVTPGISPGELRMKNECLEHGYPLIHIQNEPIGQYWKPEDSRFHACERGALLILSPWHPETLGSFNGVPGNTEYSTFHNLNAVAHDICAFEGKAEIVR